MDQLLGGPIPRETDATCDDCAMCIPEDDRESNAPRSFDPDVKCCSYVPTLPNYLIGRILEDSRPRSVRGRKTVLDRLANGEAVSPLGMTMPPTYLLLYKHSAEKAFGISKTLRCPHYLPENGGSCGIWEHRSAVCTTFFCKFVRGAVGAKFWSSLNQLLSTVEQQLSTWCVSQLDVSDESLRLLFPPRSMKSDQIDSAALDGKIDRGRYKKLWGRWFGREQEFYKESAKLVNGLDWKQVVLIGGSEIKIYERLVLDTYRGLQATHLPQFLKTNRMNVVKLDAESCCVTTYNPNDPICLPNQLIAVLHYFDGSSTIEALREITKRERLKLEPALVRKLVDFEVLIPRE
jgi:hypothetical protein